MYHTVHEHSVHMHMSFLKLIQALDLPAFLLKTNKQIQNTNPGKTFNSLELKQFMYSRWCSYSKRKF